MGSLVKPQVYLVGYTTVDADNLLSYLKDTDNLAFYDMAYAAHNQGVSEGEILCSFYAKLCYQALTPGHNDNITRTRDIPGNIRACFDHGHGSVFEHCQLNFVVRNCSRVFEAELIRHRAGTAFSIESGRYVRTDSFDLVFDPILEPVREDVIALQKQIEFAYSKMVKKMGLDHSNDFEEKKRLTSALRRVLPEGKAKEVGFSVNLRALRHIIQLRTSRHSEWEIREVFSQVYSLVKTRYPLIFHGAKEEMVNGSLEITGMKTQPY